MCIYKYIYIFLSTHKHTSVWFHQELLEKRNFLWTFAMMNNTHSDADNDDNNDHGNCLDPHTHASVYLYIYVHVYVSISVSN